MLSGLFSESSQHQWSRCCYYFKDEVQFSSATHSCLTLCNPMNHSTPGLPVNHQLPEFTQTPVYRLEKDPIKAKSLLSMAVGSYAYLAAPWFHHSKQLYHLLCSSRQTPVSHKCLRADSFGEHM